VSKANAELIVMPTVDLISSIPHAPSQPRWRCYRWQNKKPESSVPDSGFKVLPRWCRWGGYPVPLRNGRMTVAAASDFQLRRVIFSVRPSLLG